ncbi:SREBP regulating gene protein-like [Eriocheir sinensis]|uniref:SREBP regulating gene protein-like n=1 Tax=Eriocheir sinensis TaxID=95602 RepID=UPI0021CAA6C4|nr:SREBP regulating gene protein-like [Eriocheir sinensis]
MREKSPEKTMITAKIMRFLRNKVFLSVVLLVGVVYCGLSLWSESSGPGEEEGEVGNRVEFHWGPDAVNGSLGAKVTTCRNSVQGKVLLADDQGYVCHRVDRLSTGCCNVAVESTRRYACDTCNTHGCCAIYEYCVSCCLHPDKKSLLKKVLGQISENSPLYASVSDHFELCLVKCRTSSQSVQHETLYIDPRAKHCYSQGPLTANSET